MGKLIAEVLGGKRTKDWYGREMYEFDNKLKARLFNACMHKGIRTMEDAITGRDEIVLAKRVGKKTADYLDELIRDYHLQPLIDEIKNRKYRLDLHFDIIGLIKDVQLSEREEDILIRRLTTNQTYREIALDYNIHAVRIQHIEGKALKKLFYSMRGVEYDELERKKSCGEIAQRRTEAITEMREPVAKNMSRGKYSKFEAGYILDLDYARQEGVTIQDYAKRWGWNERTVSKFMEEEGYEIARTHKKKAGRLVRLQGRNKP